MIFLPVDELLSGSITWSVKINSDAARLQRIQRQKRDIQPL
jgi:hypothetical protein